MSTVKEAITPKDEAKPVSPIFTEAKHLLDEMKKLKEKISARAFEIFKGRGESPGSELEDWFKAESELLKFVPTEIVDGGDHLQVKLEVPGFKAEELKVSVEPYQLILHGKSETTDEKKEDKQVVYTEHRTNQIYRELSLPSKVDKDKVETSLKDGILSITLPKVKASEVEVKTD